jgi:hypothetical protein
MLKAASDLAVNDPGASKRKLTPAFSAAGEARKT